MISRVNSLCLERVVRAVYPAVAERVHSGECTDEYVLRREIVACILGSQVTHNMALEALDRIERAGLLADEWWSDGAKPEFEEKTLELLEGKGDSHEHTSCYRFPRVRSRQLAEARDAIARVPLKARLDSKLSARDLRRQLVQDIAGVGPKQASMFLRNARVSFDLAILDRHVLRFMAMLGLLPNMHVNVSSLRSYERVEGLVAEYADSLDCPVGCLDIAIWVTMRATREDAI